MHQIIESIAEIERDSRRIVTDSGGRKGEIFSQIQKETKEFDERMEVEAEHRLQALRGTLEGEMEVKLSEERNAAGEALRRLTEHYEENYENYVEQLFRSMTGV